MNIYNQPCVSSRFQQQFNSRHCVLKTRIKADSKSVAGKEHEIQRLFSSLRDKDCEMKKLKDIISLYEDDSLVEDMSDTKQDADGSFQDMATRQDADGSIFVEDMPKQDNVQS